MKGGVIKANYKRLYYSQGFSQSKGILSGLIRPAQLAFCAIRATQKVVAMAKICCVSHMQAALQKRMEEKKFEVCLKAV